MGIQNMPLSGALDIAGAVQTLLATSKLHLVNATFNPGANDLLANLTAIECTFSGYTAGGYAITAFLAPSFAPGGGVHVISPQVYPTFTPPGSGSPVTETVYGWYLVDSGGKLVADGTFTTPIGMLEAGDAFPITVAIVVGTQNVLVQCWVNGAMQ